jgi:hypothetical protein
MSAFGAKRKWAARQSPLPRSKMTHLRHRLARLQKAKATTWNGKTDGRFVGLDVRKDQAGS